MTEPASTPSIEKASVVEDFVDIFFTPAKVYERRRDSSAWLPLIIVTLVLAIGYMASSGLLQPLIDAEIDKSTAAALEKNPQAAANPQALEQGRAIGRTFAKVAVVVGTPIAIAFVGLGIFLTGKLVEAKQTYGAAVMIASWAFVPRILQSIVTAIQVRFLEVTSLKGMGQLSIGPARFMDPDTSSAMLVALAGRFDLFIIWTTILLAIGVSVVGRVSRASGWVAAGAVWLLGGLPALYGAMMR